MGRDYTDRGVRTRAFAMFMDRIREKDKKLASFIEDNYIELYPILMSNIQKLGLTDYANKLIRDKRGKKERKELLQ